MPAILQDCEERREVMQLWHSIGSGALVAHNDNHIAVQVTGLKRLFHGVLTMEDCGRRFDKAFVFSHS